MLVVLDDARDGASNLAIDEALLEAEGSWLRFYAWTPATISLGYFQRFEDFADVEGRYPIVRRCTGGGAILHARELTFSIAGPEALLPTALGEHIPAALSLEPEVLGALPPAIQERADALRASRYSTDAWQRRR